jgi:PKD repeat protein
MNNILLILCLFLFCFSHSYSFQKKSIIERYTNYQCGPCATLSNSWYNTTVSNLVNANSATHIVYNVNWPGSSDPMYLLNALQNSVRWRYYVVNLVPWLVVNGSSISSLQDSSDLIAAVNNGNASFSPFKLEVTAGRFLNNVINVRVRIIRAAGDVTQFGTSTSLKIGIIEKAVLQSYPALEPVYYDIIRRMLPDAKGMLIDIPAPGDTIEMESMYNPSEQFLESVNLNNLRAVVFIQNDQTKDIYQSEADDIRFSTNLNAAFSITGDLGGAPLLVSFSNLSTPTDSTAITQYLWDFDNDGVIDSDEETPEYTYTAEGVYSVSLTVSDGLFQHTRVMKNLVNIISAEADVLVVNGIDYKTAAYIPEMIRFYGSSAAYGYQQVDVWDLFGDQGFDYMANPQVKKLHLLDREIPLNALKLYNKVIWIGNNYYGDLALYNPSIVLEYLALGGNFMLATRMGSQFFNQQLKDYTGIQTFTGYLQVTQIDAVIPELVNMVSVGTNNFVSLVNLSTTSTATRLFNDLTTGTNAAFYVKKDDDGAFIYIAGRPYNYDTLASAVNYNYIIENLMTGTIVSARDKGGNIPEVFTLGQNYPNPFNPVTSIKYNVAKTGKVIIKVYDILGNEVSSLVNREMQPGEYIIKFHNSALSSGIYIYRLQAEGVNISKKMIMMK